MVSSDICHDCRQQWFRPTDMTFDTKVKVNLLKICRNGL